MEIKELIEKYETNRDYYQSPKYNETQLRADFLDPLFEMLGWDITNKSGKSNNEREVLLEEPLKAHASSNTKKPDYTFRLYSERKFFLEAKKPNVKIDTDNSPAKQTRRYGYTAKLKISLLSNFEHLAIYDCSEKVESADNVDKCRIKFYNYSEYAEKFEEIKKLVGHESVYKGEFDKEWEEIENKLDLHGVDKLFLDQINEWRLLLGTEIYKIKNDISEVDLNDLVQGYLNSIIFLRVCEDRNIEEYQTLLKFADNEDFKSLIAKFYDADNKYNSGLFTQEYKEEIIENSQSVFWTIIKKLYYPESPYSFAVFASDILGNIYEIFIAQKLGVENGEVELKDKPENVDRDVVTTPTNIIQDILRQTVIPYCEGKTDKEILSFKFADIACGSGAFLLETFQLITDILIDYYLKNDKSKLIQTSVDTYKLPFAVKKEILENCIYGVDKDYNAVEAASFGLLLKLLEEESAETLSKELPILPDLSNNIIFGNSLIKPHDKTKGKDDEINPYDFGSSKFDVIVGNPPYMATEHINQLLPLEKPIYEKEYISAYKQYDKYFLFIERGLELLKKDGFLSYIVPSKFLKVTAGKKLRKYIGENKMLCSLVDFGSEQVFKNKTTYTCLLTLKKSNRTEFKHVSVNNILDWKIKNVSSTSITNRNIKEVASDNWILIPPHLSNIYQSIQDRSVLLIDLVGRDNLNNGIQTSKNPLYIHFYSNVREDESFYHFAKDGQNWKVEKELTQPYYQTVRTGSDRFLTYRNVNANSFVIYPYKIDKYGKAKVVDIDELETKYEGLYKYFKHYEETIKKRSISPPPTEKDWYKYGRSQHLTTAFSDKKIVVGVLSNGYKYAIDYHNTFISAGGTAGYCMIKTPSESDYSIYYIQALLSSKYLEWIAYWFGEIFRGNFVARGTKVLEKLPIIKIDFSIKEEKELHNSIADKQKSLNDLQSEIDSAENNKRRLTILKRQFAAYKTTLDSELKKLFNLGSDDNLIPTIEQIYGTN